MTIVKLNRYLGIPSGKLKNNLFFGRKLLGRSCFVYKINIYRGEGVLILIVAFQTGVGT